MNKLWRSNECNVSALAPVFAFTVRECVARGQIWTGGGGVVITRICLERNKADSYIVELKVVGNKLSRLLYIYVRVLSFHYAQP